MAAIDMFEQYERGAAVVVTLSSGKEVTGTLIAVNSYDEFATVGDAIVNPDHVAMVRLRK